MLQAEADLRCPAADNEQFFIALRHLGRTVEYVLYPEEYHVYASAGRPDRRIDRMTADARLVRPLPALTAVSAGPLAGTFRPRSLAPSGTRRRLDTAGIIEA